MPVAIEGEALPVSVVVQIHPQGMYTVDWVEGGMARRSQGNSLESALGKAAGENAPESYILHAASILRGIAAKAER